MKVVLSKPDTENAPPLGQSANATKNPVMAKVNTSKEGGAEEGGSLYLDEGSFLQTDFEVTVPATQTDGLERGPGRDICHRRHVTEARHSRC